MKKVIGNKPISIIQGDTLSYRMRVGGVSIENIQKIVFTCRYLNLEKELTLTQDENYNDVYVLEYTADETEIWKAVETTFDITIFFVEGVVASETGIAFIVREKRNPTTEQV